MNNLFKKEDVFCFVNAEQARKYLNKKCYFGNSFNGLKNNIVNWRSAYILTDIEVDRDDEKIFFGVDDFDDYTINASFCIPIDKVNLEETYRPLEGIRDLASFLNKNDGNESLGNTNQKKLNRICDLLGYKMQVRAINLNKNTKYTECLVVITELNLDEQIIYMGEHRLRVTDLLDTYEFFNGEEWIPFGEMAMK